MEEEAPNKVEALKRYHQHAKYFLWRFLGNPIVHLIRWADHHHGLLTAIATVFLVAATILLALIAKWQFGALRNTDTTLHDTLVAANRAWVGPVVGSIGGLAEHQNLLFRVGYENHGREPAIEFSFDLKPHSFSAVEWRTGVAAQQLKSYADECKRTPAFDQTLVAFPGDRGYTVAIGGNLPDMREDQKIPYTDDIKNGSTFIVVEACVIYTTFKVVRHTAFCYFYNSTITNPNSLNVCDAGNYAD